MSELPHLRIEGTAKPFRYTYAGGTPQGPPKFNYPDRPFSAHARRLKAELDNAVLEAERLRAGQPHVESQPEGTVLTFFSDPNYTIRLENLERQRVGITLLSVSVKDGRQIAKVFVPQGRIGEFLNLINAYASTVILTFIGPAANEAALLTLEEPGKDVYFWGPVYKLKDNQLKVRFTMPDSEVDLFKKKVGNLAALFATTRENEKFVESISSIRLAIVEDFWQDQLPFPEQDAEIWWEIWLHNEHKENAPGTQKRFHDIAASLKFTRISDRYMIFPERIVLHAFTTARKLAESIDLLSMLSELRKGKEVPIDYLNLAPRDQGAFAKDLISRLQFPEGDPPCVTIMDSGVNNGHPLLEPILSTKDCHASIAHWGHADHDPEQHGTEMAGIAAYGCLTEVFSGAGPIVLRHRLESVKILPPPNERPTDPPDYGYRTQDGVAQAHIKNPRRNRVLCMPVTADSRDMGSPTLWSSAVDSMCAGVEDGAQKLMMISVGNASNDQFNGDDYVYHEWNTQRGATEDPSQAWNALSVGAVTDRIRITDPTLRAWNPIAETGDLCPTSRTSLVWPKSNQDEWPIKPDIVMEGGNYMHRHNRRSDVEDLSLLTTHLHANGGMFGLTKDTSAATAGAARLAAILWSRYPRLRPETIRGLLVHSARWTDAMLKRFKGDQKRTVHRRLRCYGYGVPNLMKALSSAENNVNLLFEGELQPFMKEDGVIKTNEMHIHTIPWPTKILEDLGEQRVTMRVTLSYFIEPSPGRISWEANESYRSHGLRFDVIRLPSESLDEFKQRISQAQWQGKKRPVNGAKETRKWVIGDQGRSHGCIHSDWWVGKGAELAVCNKLAVYPVSGWWQNRRKQKQFDRKARYSLIISIEAPEINVDLYSEVKAMSEVATEIMA